MTKTNKLSIELVQERIDERYGKGKIQVLQYTATKKPLLLKCLVCGHEWTAATLSSFLSENAGGCTVCRAKQRLLNVDVEKVQHQIDNKFGEGKIQVLQHISTKTKSIYCCLIC